MDSEYAKCIYPGNSSREKRLQKCMSGGFSDDVSVESIETFPSLANRKSEFRSKLYPETRTIEVVREASQNRSESNCFAIEQ